MLTDAIQHYHDLLTPAVAAESQDRLDEQQRRRGLGFGGRLLSTVLRPRFLTLEQYRYLRQRVRPLLQACAIIHQAAVAEAGFRAQFALTPEEEDLFHIAPGYRCPIPTARLDAFFVTAGGGRRPDALRFTEINAETPAAAAYTDELADVFLNLPVMGAFQTRYHAFLPPARPGTLQALLACWKEWGGQGLPRIGILDWKEVPTYPEFVLWHDYLARQGIMSRIIDPREVEFTGGKLHAEGFAVDLIYKRVLISELVERGGLRHPVFEALRARAVCMVNPLVCKPLYKKASLAVLSDEINARLFSAEQQLAIAEHVPWTRLLKHRHTLYDGQEHDLVPFVRAHKDRLVLKPNDDYGGKGIVLGWMVSASEWDEAIEAGLQRPTIVQQRVELPREPFPAWTDGTLHITERMLDTAPFVTMGSHVEGCLTRIGTDPLLNVSAGGGSTVPTFVIEPR